MKHTARRLSEAQCKQVKMVVVCQTLKILQVERTIQFKMFLRQFKARRSQGIIETARRQSLSITCLHEFIYVLIILLCRP